MLTGLKGVKYGLQPGAKAKEQAPPPPRLSVFADDDEEEPGTGAVSSQVARQAAQKAADAKVAKAHAAAIAEDPSVFDYDGVYDSIQQERVLPKQQEKEARKSRYIEGLLDKAKGRAQEQDIIYERKLARERAAEDYLFGDKDRFVTAAYKRKLQEDKLWVAADRAREQAEAQQEAQRIGHMGNFYRNVLTNNEAFGTNAAKGGAPGPAEAPGPSQPGPAPVVDAEFEAARKARAAYEEAREQQAAGQPGGAASAPAAEGGQEAAGGQAAAGSGRGEEARAGAASAAAEARGPGRPQPEPAPGGGEAGPSSQPVPGAAQAGDTAAEGEGRGPGGFAVAHSTADERAAKAEAARQRFLARKRKAPG